MSVRRRIRRGRRRNNKTKSFTKKKGGITDGIGILIKQNHITECVLSYIRLANSCTRRHRPAAWAEWKARRQNRVRSILLVTPFQICVPLGGLNCFATLLNHL